MQQRILGFDLARAYAIFGMYIVNFTFCFGRFDWFSSLFVGNSSSIFIICAGMGVILMSEKSKDFPIEQKKIKSIILRRSWFLFILGILLFSWWPSDILHFYGGYLHIAAFMLFLRKKYYLWFAFLFILIYNLLQIFIPITTSWDMKTTQYLDFWTPIGFIRNTFYNGWNSIFPWFAYFSLGMFLGKLNWHDKTIQKKVFAIGLIFIVIFKGLRIFIRADFNHPVRNEFYTKYWMQLMEDYFPANIPFLMITTGFALMIIAICMYLGNRFSENKILHILVKTGQMTLTNYVFHMTIGVLILQFLSSKKYTGFPLYDAPLSANFIFSYVLILFTTSVIFSNLWLQKYKKGPLEMLMRKISKS
jgi:uncharacterized protein